MRRKRTDTVERLEQLRHLRAETELLNERIGELELAAQGGAAQITGMPRGGRRRDRVGEIAAKIADLETLLDERRAQCLEELERLYGFIGTIDDSLTRQVFTYRYVDGLSWHRVAVALGEADEQFPRRLHNRYLRERGGAALTEADAPDIMAVSEGSRSIGL